MLCRFLAIGALAIFAWYKRQGSVSIVLQSPYRDDTNVQSCDVNLGSTQLAAAELMKMIMEATSFYWLKG